MRIFGAASIAMALLASVAQAEPGERDRLDNCKAMVDRIPQAQHASPDKSAGRSSRNGPCGIPA
jgi:hypothetical protein